MRDATGSLLCFCFAAARVGARSAGAEIEALGAAAGAGGGEGGAAGAGEGGLGDSETPGLGAGSSLGIPAVCPSGTSGFAAGWFGAGSGGGAASADRPWRNSTTGGSTGLDASLIGGVVSVARSLPELGLVAGVASGGGFVLAVDGPAGPSPASA